MKNIINRFLGETQKSSADTASAAVPAAEQGVRQDELAYYEQVWAELESGQQNRGLWARCYAEADGDPEKAKARYLKLRVGQLVGDDESRRDEQLHRLREQRRHDEERRQTELQQQQLQQQQLEEAARRKEAQRLAEEAEQRRLQQAEKLREERRRGLHGRQAQDEQLEQDFLGIVTRVRQRSDIQRHKIEPQSVDHWGCNRLIRAAQKGRYEEILQMIADGDNPLDGDASGMSARAHAEIQGHEKCVQFLDIAERVWEKNRGRF